MMKAVNLLLFILLVLASAVFCVDMQGEPQLMPGMEVPQTATYHCEGGGGHTPHDHSDPTHKHYMEQPKFLDGGSGGWQAQDVSQGGMGFVPAGGSGGVPKDKDEL